MKDSAPELNVSSSETEEDKEEAKLELNIEKEKHQEIIQKYKKEQEELQMKVCHYGIHHHLMDLKL